MKSISVANAQKQLPELVEALNEGPVLLLNGRQPCAALVGLSERFDGEAFSLGRHRALRRLVEEACLKTKKGGGVPFAAIVAEVAERQSREKARKARLRRRSR